MDESPAAPAPEIGDEAPLHAAAPDILPLAKLLNWLWVQFLDRTEIETCELSDKLIELGLAIERPATAEEIAEDTGGLEEGDEMIHLTELGKAFWKMGRE